MLTVPDMASTSRYAKKPDLLQSVLDIAAYRQYEGNCAYCLSRLFFSDRHRQTVLAVALAPRISNFGPFILQERVGQGGSTIKIIKLRTMRPATPASAEQLRRIDAKQGIGKPAGDERATRIGKLMRRYWLDELPQLLNLLSGDIKVTGVRPMLRQELELQAHEYRQEYLRVKPGLVSVAYAAPALRGPQARRQFELEYLRLYQRAPFRTDARYLLNALFGIIFRGFRGQ